MEPHDHVLRARIVEGPGSPSVARGVDAIARMIRSSLELVEVELAAAHQ
jgi:hypothetical protein